MVNLKRIGNTVLSKYNRTEDFRPEQEKNNFTVGLRCSSLTKLPFVQGMGLMAAFSNLVSMNDLQKAFVLFLTWWKGPGS